MYFTHACVQQSNKSFNPSCGDKRFHRSATPEVVVTTMRRVTLVQQHDDSVQYMSIQHENVRTHLVRAIGQHVCSDAAS